MVKHDSDTNTERDKVTYNQFIVPVTAEVWAMQYDELKDTEVTADHICALAYDLTGSNDDCRHCCFLKKEHELAKIASLM